MSDHLSHKYRKLCPHEYFLRRWPQCYGHRTTTSTAATQRSGIGQITCTSFVDYFLNECLRADGWCVVNRVCRLNPGSGFTCAALLGTVNDAELLALRNTITDFHFSYEAHRWIDHVFDAHTTATDCCDCVTDFCGFDPCNVARAPGFYLNSFSYQR